MQFIERWSAYPRLCLPPKSLRYITWSKDAKSWRKKKGISHQVIFIFLILISYCFRTDVSAPVTKISVWGLEEVLYTRSNVLQSAVPVLAADG